MKKLFKLSYLLSFFILAGATTSYSQDFIKNSTDCSFSVTVLYSYMNAEGCEVTGYDTFTIPGGSNQIIPNDNFIIEAKGYSFGGSCPFYISRNECGPYKYYEKIHCEDGCSTLFKAQFLSGIGMEISD